MSVSGLLLALMSSMALVSTNKIPQSKSPELVTNLVSFLKVPLKVTLLVCWPKDETANFVRQLNLWPSRGSPGKPLFVQAGSDSVQNLQLLDTLEVHQQFVIVDVACPRTKELLGKAQHRIYHRTRWLLLDGDRGWNVDSEKEVFDATGSLPVTGSSEVFYFSGDMAGGKVSIRNVYRISMQSDLISEEVGVWFNGTIEDRRSGQSVSLRRKNLQQLPLRTTLLYTDNFTLDHFDDYEISKIDAHNRISYLMIKTMYQIYLNATFVKRYRTTWCYPSLKSGGLMGVCVDLVNNNSEVGAFMFINSFRLNLMDFVPLGVPGPIRFIFKAPKMSITNNIFQLPFDFMVWVCLLGLVIMLVIIFYLMNSLDGYRTRPLASKITRYDQVFNAIAIAVQQGSLLVSKSTFQRSLVLISVIGFMFLHVSYSAKIFSLIQAPSEQIDSLSELLNSRLEVAGHDISYNHFYLTTPTEPVRKALYDKKLKRTDGSLNVFSLEEGVAKIKKGLFAFHALNSAVVHVIRETFDETEKCFIRELKFIDSSDIYLAVQRNFTLREHFNVGMARIREVGVYKREYAMIQLEAKLNCVKGVDFESLSLVDVRFAMELIGGGLLGAAVLLVVEISWGRWRRSRMVAFEFVN